MDQLFWRDKTVFVTGHTGFKGSWLTLLLESMGARVIGYALAPVTNPNLFTLARVGSSVTSIEADISDLGRLRSAMRDFCPDIVIHLAAQSLVRASYDNPIATYATNIMGTVNLLEAVRATTSVRAAVIITSDKCYENREWVWGYREDEPMGGYDPYSSSKGCAELITAAYRRSFFAESTCAAIATARAGNVIGGGDWAKDRLVPDILTAFIAGRPVTIRNPGAVRPWQHVLEPLHGYLILAERLWRAGATYGGGWNFGPLDHDVKPVSWIVERLVQTWGGEVGWEIDGTPHPHEAACLKLDCSKAREQLKWIPRLDICRALEWTVDWYKAYSANEDMRARTLQQIGDYQVAGADA